MPLFSLKPKPFSAASVKQDQGPSVLSMSQWSQATLLNVDGLKLEIKVNEKSHVEVSTRIRSVMFRYKLCLISLPKARVYGVYKSVNSVELH